MIRGVFMKKAIFVLLFALCFSAACKHTQSPYNRNDHKETYEEFINKHVFAACTKPGNFLATYSLAKVKQRPANNDPRYKLLFVNGPCKDQIVWTTDIIFKTEPIENARLKRGMVVLRNYDNPDEYNKEKTGHWNKAVISSTDRYDKGIIDLAFPRDKNDFNPARESIYSYNVRLIVKPTAQDIRTFL